MNSQQNQQGTQTAATQGQTKQPAAPRAQPLTKHNRTTNKHSSKTQDETYEPPTDTAAAANKQTRTAARTHRRTNGNQQVRATATSQQNQQGIQTSTV